MNNKPNNFKVWCNNKKEWEKDPSFLNKAGELCRVEVSGCIVHYKPESYVVVFSTGRKDKNGVEVYEGDVLTNGDINNKYIVEWLDCGLRARQLMNKSTIGLTYWQSSLEVVGNRFENPELLEGT